MTYSIIRTSELVENDYRSWQGRLVDHECSDYDMGYAVLDTFDVVALCPDRNIAQQIKEALEVNTNE